IAILLIGPAQSNYIKIVPEYTHSHTKAVCDNQNLCQDYEIFCKNNEIVKMNPITGAVVQFPEDWQDPRNPEIKNGFC
ncbi:unnamed protein product, partial [marine sediment metagenome]